MHNDNLGQAIKPGDIVLSVRSSTNYVPRMIVLKHTLKKVVTNSGAYEPNTLLNVTSNLLALGDHKTINDLRTEHADKIVADDAVVKPPKSTIRYEVLELYHTKTDVNSTFSKSAKQLAIIRVESVDSETYNANRQLTIDYLRGLGYTFGYYSLSPHANSSRSYSRTPRDYSWTFTHSNTGHRLSAKKLKEMGIDGIQVNEPIATEVFNQDAVKDAKYLPENFT